MKQLFISVGLVLIFGFCQVFAASFASHVDLRSQSMELECQLVSLRLNSEHQKSAKKYLGKIVKATEEKNGSSKSSSSIGDLKETIDKYSKKLVDLINDCCYLTPERQIQAFELVKAFLDEFGNLDENISCADDHFIENLRTLPPGTIASHYAELWNSLNALEAQNLPRDELLMFLDSAVVNFTRQFTTSVNRDLGDLATNPELGCIYSACSSTYHRALAKITEVLPTEDIAGERK